MTAAIQWPFGTYTNSELKLTMNINRSKNNFFFLGGVSKWKKMPQPKKPLDDAKQYFGLDWQNFIF